MQLWSLGQEDPLEEEWQPNLVFLLGKSHGQGSLVDYSPWGCKSVRQLSKLLLLSPVMSDSVWPHRRQPTRLLCPWDSPGKNTGVGCHFLLQCMKVKTESEVAQSCPTLSDPMVWNLPGSSVHGVFQARVLEWGAIAFSELEKGNASKLRE